MKCLCCGFEFDEGCFCPECGTKISEVKIITKKCNKCGFEFDEGIFCPECGSKVNDELEIDNVAQNIVKENIDVVTDKSELLNVQVNTKEILEDDAQNKELEKERINLERAKLEKERLEIEEKNLKIQKEMQKAKEDEEKKQAEIASRTYKGVVYSSIEEMKNVKEEDNNVKAQKKVDALAIWSFVLSLLPFTVIGAYFFWATGIAALVLGILALKGKTRKKGFAIAGIIIDGVMLLLMIAVVLFCIINYA